MNFYIQNILISADDVNASISNGADALDKTKEDLNALANDASTLAERAKTAGGTLFDHAKGAANEAIAAGSKAAESIADEKLKQAENVNFYNIFIHFLNIFI